MSEAREGHASDLADTLLALTGTWVGRLVQGRRVLDASCSIGAATRELFAAAAELVVATPKVAVAEAIGDLVSSRVSAHHTRLDDLPLEANSFDAVVSLGVRDTGALAGLTSEFCRVLKPDTGLLVLSAEAARDDQASELGTDGEHLRRALDSRFTHVTTVRCSPHLAAAFLSADVQPVSPQDPSGTVVVGARGVAEDHGSVLNSLVIGSQTSLQSYNLPGLVSVPFEVSQLQRDLTELSSLLREYGARAKSAEQMFDDNARLLRELFAVEQVVAEEFDRRARREEVTLLHSGSEQELAQIRQQLSDARRELDAVRSTVSWRVTRPLRTLRRYLK